MVSISNSSDPYPNLEEKMGLTRKSLEILSQRNCKIQIITKSPLVARDIDLLKKIPSMVSLTITTNDDNIAKLIEPHAPPPSERLKAVKTLIINGIPTCVRIDPIVPFVNDNPEGLIEALASIAIKHVTVSTYKVKIDNWKRLSMAIPETAEKLKPLYFERGEKTGRCIYMPKDTRLKLINAAREICRRRGIKFGTCREGLSYLNTAVCDGSWLLAKKR
jgi:DNA repair photolyase